MTSLSSPVGVCSGGIGAAKNIAPAPIYYFCRAILAVSRSFQEIILAIFFVKLFGFSINVLTLFAMVMAIGILVDDAIVVIENVERIMTEEGLSPREATIKSMGQISGAVVAITVVLAAVFIPSAFQGGSAGEILAVVTDTSDRYHDVALHWAVAALLLTVLPLTRGNPSTGRPTASGVTVNRRTWPSRNSATLVSPVVDISSMPPPSEAARLCATAP